MTWHPPEILFALDSVSVHTYGVVLAIAIGVAFLWGERRAVARGLPKHLASDIFFWAVLGALVGARLGFVMQEFGYFSAHPPEILAFWQGGLSFHGGLVGGLIAGLIVLKKRHAMTQFWLLADAAAAPLLLGAAIGRLGNWANQELYGYPTDVPWAITIDAAHRLPGYEAFATFHPTFAYEIILNLTGLLILLFLLEKKKPLQATSYKLQAGKTFLFFLAWYSLARGLTELWRISDRLIGPPAPTRECFTAVYSSGFHFGQWCGAGLSLAQLISLGLVVAVSLVLLARYRLDKKSPQS